MFLQQLLRPFSPEPNRFRFLELPGLAQENILKRVNLMDIVSLSLCSTRTANCINSLRFPNLRDPEGPLSGGGVHVEITNAHVSVVFQDKGPKLSLRIQDSKGAMNYKDVIFSPLYRKHNCYSERRGRRRRGGRPQILETHLIADHSGNHAEAAKRAVEHICYIFRLPVVRVSINVHEIRNFWNLFIWDLLRGSCADVQLHGETIQDCEKNKFFENFRIEKGLAFEVKNCGDLSFQMDKLRNLDYLMLRNASWMEDHHFEQLNCEFLEVRGTQITAQAINNWLHNWMRSSETRTKVLIISPVSNTEGFDRSVILQGLNCDLIFDARTEFTGKFGTFTHSYDCTEMMLWFSVFGGMNQVTRADGATARITGREEIRVYISYK